MYAWKRSEQFQRFNLRADFSVALLSLHIIECKIKDFAIVKTQLFWLSGKKGSFKALGSPSSRLFWNSNVRKNTTTFYPHPCLLILGGFCVHSDVQKQFISRV